MRRTKEIIQAASAGVIVASMLTAGMPTAAGAQPANGPSLVISQLKITSSNGQFITLYNASDATLDMSKYRLEYFNNYDLGKVTSSRLINLSGSLPPHSYFMVNDDSLTLCYRLTVDSVSLGFSSTAGLVEVSSISQTQPGSPVGPVLQDYVGWSKTAAAGAQTLPSGTTAFLERQPVDGQNNPAVTIAGAGSWLAVQPDAANVCGLVSTANPATPVPTGLSELLPASEPAATIMAVNDSGVAPPALPPADIGLMAPTITELLPNPAGTGNDVSDEFIELYNPNGVVFDLSGFSLQAGKRTYSFPAGSSLPPRGFQTLYTSLTGLSLSNSGGQVKLLDPFLNSIFATGVYGSAKDGQAWALASGKWYWTTKLTPGAANIINQPSSIKKTSRSGAKKSAKSTAHSKTKKTKVALAAKHAPDHPAPATPIHVWSLALIAIAAILYGAYEYREDINNRIYELRSYLRARREDRA